MDNILEIRYNLAPIVFMFVSLAWLWYNAKKSLYQGAYTGVCSAQHVPSYMKNIDKFKAKGIDSVVCVAVNDPYTMTAWAEKLQAKDAVSFFTSVLNYLCILHIRCELTSTSVLKLLREIVSS